MYSIFVILLSFLLNQTLESPFVCVLFSKVKVKLLFLPSKGVELEYS